MCAGTTRTSTHRIYRVSIIADKQTADSSDNSRAELGFSCSQTASDHYDLHMQLKYSRSAGALYFIEHA